MSTLAHVGALFREPHMTYEGNYIYMNVERLHSDKVVMILWMDKGLRVRVAQNVIPLTNLDAYISRHNTPH